MNNLNFSKNVFGGGMETKIAGNPINSYSQDGGRRSVEEVRQDQLNADRGINPDAGKEFQVNLQQSYSKPLNNQNPSLSYSNNGQTNDLQLEATRARMESMQNLGRRGF